MQTLVLETSKAPDLYNYNSKMIGREIALEALGVLCNAEVIVVNQSDGSRGSLGDGSRGADSFFTNFVRFWGGDVQGNDNVPAGDASGGADLFCIDQLIPRVLKADQRRFTGNLQITDEMKEIKPTVSTQGGTISGFKPSIYISPGKDVSKDPTTGQIKLKIAVDEKELFDPGYDYDFTNLKDTETYYRGGEKYERPCGYKRFALKVRGKYEDDTWLGRTGRGTQSVEGEWPVSYHGTKEWWVDPIIKGNLKAGSRAKHGRGIYSTPHISVAEDEEYAKTFTSKKDNKRYKVILQNRINPKYREKCEKEPGYWLIRVPKGTSDEEEKDLVKRAIRPYGLLIKEVK